MIFADEFDAIMREHMDISDTETRRSLIGLDEADKSKMLVSLTSKLYDKIVEKVDDINYGTIPASRGDITKIENYESMMECIDIIYSILKQYNQNTEPVDTIITAINNVKSRKDLFVRAYMMNVELPIVFYNNITLSIVSSISFLIAVCIEFIKNPGDDSFTVSLDKVAYTKTSKNLILDNLRKFNVSCAKGELDRSLNECLKVNTKNLSGGLVVLSAIALIGLAKVIIPILQELTYFFYSTPQTISDYFAVQADLLQMNTANIVYRDMDEDKKKKVISKQTKIADRFRKISNFFNIEYKKAEKKSKESREAHKKKYKTTDITTTAPDSSSLF